MKVVTGNWKKSLLAMKPGDKVKIPYVVYSEKEERDINAHCSVKTTTATLKKQKEGHWRISASGDKDKYFTVERKS